MLSFENTEIAFYGRSNFELRRNYWLFKFMASHTLVYACKHLLNFFLKIHFPVSWILKPTLFKHFCGGETLAEAAKTINILQKRNTKTILDYSVEGKETTESYNNALNEILATVEFASKNKNIPFTVFKPSALGNRLLLEKASNGSSLTNLEQDELNLFQQRIDTLCNAAFNVSVPIMIDAEHFHYQNIIDTVCENMMRKYNQKQAIVFNTLQMYRTDRLHYLEKIFEDSKRENFYLGIKFVRGAYMEKERERAKILGYQSPIHEDKTNTDIAYNSALRFSIKHIDRIEIFNGTHNEESSLLLTKLIEIADLPKDDKRIWFSQLYGMSDNISFNLASEGYNVAKYVPYGPVKHVLPYLIRRAEENTSVKGQTSREMAMIVKEIKRRK